MKIQRLFQRTLFGIFFLFGLIGVSTSILCIYTVDIHLSKEYESNSKGIAKTIADASVDIILNRDLSALQSLIDQFVEIQGISYIYITSESSEFLAQSFVPGIQRPGLTPRFSDFPVILHSREPPLTAITRRGDSQLHQAAHVVGEVLQPDRPRPYHPDAAHQRPAPCRCSGPPNTCSTRARTFERVVLPRFSRSLSGLLRYPLRWIRLFRPFSFSFASISADRPVRPHLRGRVVRIENVIHNLAVVHRRVRHLVTPHQLVPAVDVVSSCRAS